MRVLIFEDEKLTADRLIQLLGRIRGDWEIITVLDSIKSGRQWFDKNQEKPNLILMDIRLSDGLCFSLFNYVKIDIPVIFTTAYDEYAIQAFKVNSVDYLLKPIDTDDLLKALVKFENHYLDVPDYSLLFQNFNKNYKSRFLVKIGDQLKFIQNDEIAYFMYNSGLVDAVLKNDNRYPLDQSLDYLEKKLDPSHFFRINRKFIVGLDSIHKINSYFNSRLKLTLYPECDEDVIVSREKVQRFKLWLDDAL
jgi:DNA-binding LytR/AlgR family response regulator